MQQQTNNTNDHDFIPNEWQEPEGPRAEQPLAKARSDDAHDLGQMAERPAAGRAQAQPKKQSLLGRLFGTKPEKEIPAPKIEKEDLAQKPVRPAGVDWNPIDLSHGTVKTGIFGDKRHFVTNVKHDLKQDLGSILNAGQRKTVADEISKLRSHGLRRGEVRKKIDQLKDKGVINKFEAKRLRREFKANKSTGIF